MRRHELLLRVGGTITIARAPRARQKTAKALGVTVPQSSILARADAVIE
jgi:hypothetical protein